nr:transketolase C-terminal domain-containing protein [Kineobactrum salinum]
MPLLWTLGSAPEPGSYVPLGKARTVREGTDATVITYGRQVFEAVAAAEELQKQDISVEVIDLRSISPWDKEAVLKSVSKTHTAIVLHEAVRNFGPGAEIASSIQEELFGVLSGPVLRLGGAFSPVPFSNVLESAFVPGIDEIVGAIKQATSRKPALV